MNIGQLNRRITLQTRSGTLDAYGQEVNVWSNFATVWANIKPVSGREKAGMATIDVMLTHRITIRYRVEFMPPTTVDAWRILYPTKAGDRIFNITASQDMDEAHEYIVLDVQEGSQTGAG